MTFESLSPFYHQGPTHALFQLHILGLISFWALSLGKEPDLPSWAPPCPSSLSKCIFFHFYLEEAPPLRKPSPLTS